MNLDKLRGQAKYAAWYDDPDDPPSYNPFRKVRTGLSTKKNTLRTAENGDSDLTRSITDQEDQHMSNVNRQAQMVGASGVPQRYATAPISDRSHTKAPVDDSIPEMELNRTVSPEEEVVPLEKGISLPSEQTKDTTSGDTLAAEETGTNEKPRQRKGLKGMFHREKKVADSDKPEEEDVEKPHYTFANQLKATLFNSWINILLLAGKLDSPSILPQNADHV
jgi:Ca2+:H+ antiporter